MFEFLNHLDFWVTIAAVGVTLYAVLISPYRKKQRKARRAEERRLAAVAEPSSSPESAPALAAPPARPLHQVAWSLPEAEDRLPAPRWLHLLNDRPDDVPHVLIVAPSRCGKTTFATALLGRRKGAVIVLTPKPEDRWGGLPSRLTIDDDGSFRTITRAFSVLLIEVRRRLVGTKRGEQPTETLTIVIDDAPALISMAGKGASEVVKLVARLGASLRVRLILISHTTRVQSLAIDGEGDVLDNFALIRMTPASEDTPRTANLTWGQTDRQPLDLKLVPNLAIQADLSGAGWHLPAASRSIMYETTALPDDEENSGNFSVPVSAQESLETSFPDSWKLLIAQGIGAGKSKTEIVQGLPGYSGRKHRVASDAYDSVMRELGLVLETKEG